MNVIWAPQAKQDFWNNIDYLEAEWSEKIALSFIEKVNTTIELLKNDNVLFLKTNYKNVYKIVITKHISLYYRIENTNLELLRFWNTFQDTEKFKL
ncbi:ParE toxin of type II toxin-antitoxin system, parDE [Flavobacterium resistens]|uniref:ParE toxin of type II toxin-antitoxin system, parDE n=1 Tax=Flavobacterium resistens TaxID=443612 RepID=A0A521EUD7_9FLAO|nr:type II toxin-antitoxin system RelE/ParE family toxin [Flavobacterium resistens]MRX68018.1 type II toxin-antitoxin system RelE/ParE family toxin [Flavobacterium resistens]SMO87566.1 ParE toxin of type II toxin-antitoxin system, parDE [Flavobacterium resistens]